MNHTTLFPLGVWQCDGGREVAVVGDTSVASHPLVVPLSGVHHGPRDDGVGLPVSRVALPLAGHALANAVAIVPVLELVGCGSVFKSGK
jgi:hypothetical protein